jgi:hypothetical protein
MKVRSPCIRPAMKECIRVGGPFFQIFVGRPSISIVSISNGEPGWVSRAWAWASDIAGQAGGPGRGLSFGDRVGHGVPRYGRLLRLWLRAIYKRSFRNGNPKPNAQTRYRLELAPYSIF